MTHHKRMNEQPAVPGLGRMLAQRLSTEHAIGLTYDRTLKDYTTEGCAWRGVDSKRSHDVAYYAKDRRNSYEIDKQIIYVCVCVPTWLEVGVNGWKVGVAL